MGELLKLSLVFYNLSKKYARDLIAGGGQHYVYSDDGDGNITITIEED